jgi:hypothetical protein
VSYVKRRCHSEPQGICGAPSLASGTGNKQSASTSEQSHNEISQMTSYTKQGRYDDAVQLVLELLKN